MIFYGTAGKTREHSQQLAEPSSSSSGGGSIRCLVGFESMDTAAAASELTAFLHTAVCCECSVCAVFRYTQGQFMYQVHSRSTLHACHVLLLL